MSSQNLKSKASYFAILLLTTCYLPLAAKRSLASTDPQDATASATATVPVFSGPSPNQPPTPPILVNPFDGAVTNDTTPEFVWRLSSDPDDNTISYTLLLDNVATFLGVSGSGNSGSTTYSSHVDGTEVYLTPTNSLSEGYHTWKVIAYDLAGNETSSTQWGFTIDTTAPFINVVDVDNYHEPIIQSGTIFDINGPKDVYFTIKTEPYATITLHIFDDSGTVFRQAYPSGSSGLVYPYVHLELGLYQVDISSFDHAGLTSTVPTFVLNIKQGIVTIPLPPIPGLPGVIEVPFTFSSPPSLPATVARLTTRENLAITILLLLSLALFILLIILWKHRYNLLVLDVDGHPVKDAKVYHSKPGQHATHYFLKPKYRGKLYIQGLGRYSTLTIVTDRVTLVVSLSRNQSKYTLIV